LKAFAHRPLLLALLVMVALHASAARGEERDEGATRAAALQADYEKLLKHADFASFSRRMEAVRDLGRLDHPLARAILIDIVRSAKLVDDQAVAVLSLGARVDVATARVLADVVARRPAPALVEALGDAFGRANDVEVLAWLATEALEHKSPAVLQAALDAEYAHGDPRIRERAQALYAEYAPKRDGMAIAHAAVRALGSVGGLEVRPFLLGAASHANWRIRLAVADVMASQKPFDVNVRGTLRKLLTDDEPVVRQRTAASVGESRITELLPEVAALLDDSHVKTRAVAHDALRHLTHKDLGYDPEDWIEWWKHQTEEVGAIKPSPSSSVVTYYGVSVRSDRLIFVVDVSGSMSMPKGGTTTRIEVARRELRRVLALLDPDTLFNVIVFSDKVKAWRKGQALATKDNVARVTQWLDRTLAEPRGGTFMYAAFEKAFTENPDMDTMYLLTDGLASDGEPIVPEAILASIDGWNRYRRVTIDTFALTLEDETPATPPAANLEPIKAFMRQVAAITGGRCTVVTKAP